jgi:4-hydroxybenzoate polyprenyltransferase
MSSKTESIQKKIGATRWINWALLAVWVLLLVFLAQNAIASQAELEPRAAIVFWVSAVVVLIAGAIIAGMRMMRRPKA